MSFSPTDRSSSLCGVCQVSLVLFSTTDRSSSLCGVGQVSLVLFSATDRSSSLCGVGQVSLVLFSTSAQSSSLCGVGQVSFGVVQFHRPVLFTLLSWSSFFGVVQSHWAVLFSLWGWSIVVGVVQWQWAVLLILWRWACFSVLLIPTDGFSSLFGVGKCLCYCSVPLTGRLHSVNVGQVSLVFFNTTDHWHFCVLFFVCVGDRLSYSPDIEWSLVLFSKYLNQRTLIPGTPTRRPVFDSRFPSR